MAEQDTRGRHSIAAIRAMPETARAMVEDRTEEIASVTNLLAPARRILTFEFNAYPRPFQPDDAVVVISHRGYKQYSVAGVLRAHAAGIPVALVTAQDTRYPGAEFSAVIHTVAQEQSSMHTYSLTGAATALACVAVELARRSGNPASEALADGLLRLPDALQTLLAQEPLVKRIAEEALARRASFAFVGSGPNAATAPEAALKVKEGAHVTAEGFGIEQFLHGPLVAVAPNDLVTLIAPPGPSQRRALETLAAVSEIGAPVWLLGAAAFGAAAYETALPDLPEPLTPIAALAALNLLAYWLGMLRGVDPDNFRRDQDAYRRAADAVAL
ncbi:MAG: SIS domain-containing protein [Chloroflexi bacterium]|nr:SIS domain-containing protein [Chloroflexota bacterium]